MFNRALRISTLAIVVVALGVMLWLRPAALWADWVVAALAALGALGIWDMVQRSHAILRNYPILGHARWLIELIRPEIRQYLIESDTEATPFSRAQRSLVYRRAKQAASDHPFGTLVDVYARDYEFIQQSLTPIATPDPADFRITIGNDQCTRPYSASVFNISGMSFGALSANAIRALNKGAAMGRFYHDTGEGSISAYHLEHGGDLVWQVASGYFGCRSADGRFDPARFAEQAALPQVKMIELKLSQGAKPGHGGVLPGPKVTAEIARTRGVPIGVDCVSPSRHSAFDTPVEMMAFLARLRALSGG
jgi:glutamate synthase domain-containing protein 2